MRDEERKELARRALAGDADALVEFVERAVSEAVAEAMKDAASRFQKEPWGPGELRRAVRDEYRRHIQREAARDVAPAPVELTYATNTADVPLRLAGGTTAAPCPVCGAFPPCQQDCR